MGPIGPRELVFLSRRQQMIDEGETDVDPLDAEFSESFRVFCEERASAYNGLDREQQLRATENFPGYLAAQIDGWTIFAPWVLVTTFPGREALSKLISVAEHAAIAPVEGVCISGSSAWLGAEIEVGDLDFSQYLEMPSSELEGKAHRFTTPANALALIEARYTAAKANAPWESEWPTLAAAMANTCPLRNLSD